MLKKIIALSLFMLALTSCNNTQTNQDNSSDTTSVSSQAPPVQSAVEIPELPVVNADSMTYFREYNLDYFQGAEYNTFLFPKITIETETVTALNLLMLTEATKFGDDTDYSGGIYNYVKDTTKPITDLRCNVNVNYQYSVQNDVIAIVIEYYRSYFMSEMMSVLDYYYDIKNDKILSREQYLKTQNVNADEIVSVQAKVYPDIPFKTPDDISAVICYENGICKAYGAGINGASSAFDLDLKNNTEAVVVSSDLTRYFTSTYQKARDAFCWFRMGSMPLSNNTVQRGDFTYYKVEHPTIKSVAQLREYMLSLFDKTIVDDLFKKGDNFPDKCIDIDGELYCMDTGRGSDISVGDEAFEVIELSDSEYTFRIKCETLNFDTEMPVVDGFKTVDQTLEKRGNEYVFTKFSLTR